MDLTGAQGTLFPEQQRATAADEDFFDLRDVVAGCDDLPEIVRSAEFSRIDSRFLDKRLFHSLIAQQPPAGSEEDWSTRIWHRETALLPFVGKFLMCVLIRLPGVHYTIEVDPHSHAVVHWEWQGI